MKEMIFFSTVGKKKRYKIDWMNAMWTFPIKNKRKNTQLLGEKTPFLAKILGHIIFFVSFGHEYSLIW